MKVLIACLLLFLTFAECPDHDSKVTSLDAFNPSYTFPCMYAGWLTIKDDFAMFYWFFRHKDESKTSKKPLIVWI